MEYMLRGLHLNNVINALDDLRKINPFLPVSKSYSEPYEENGIEGINVSFIPNKGFGLYLIAATVWDALGFRFGKRKSIDRLREILDEYSFEQVTFENPRAKLMEEYR